MAMVDQKSASDTSTVPGETGKIRALARRIRWHRNTTKAET
jgi:hypothetical protein